MAGSAGRTGAVFARTLLDNAFRAYQVKPLGTRCALVRFVFGAGGVCLRAAVFALALVD